MDLGRPTRDLLLAAQRIGFAWDLPPPTSAAAGWRPTLMPTVAMIISMYVRVQQYHASTRTPPTHLVRQQHTHCPYSTHTTHLAIAPPALPSSRLPRASHHFIVLMPLLFHGHVCAGSSARTSAMVTASCSLSNMATASWQSNCPTFTFLKLPFLRNAGRRDVPRIFHSFDIWRFVYVVQCCKCRLHSAVHHTCQAWPCRPVSP